MILMKKRKKQMQEQLKQFYLQFIQHKLKTLLQIRKIS